MIRKATFADEYETFKKFALANRLISEEFDKELRKAFMAGCSVAVVRIKDASTKMTPVKMSLVVKEMLEEVQAFMREFKIRIIGGN